MFLPAWTTSQEPDFKPYQNAAVVFGPFEISGFLVSGQNTILFMDPISYDLYCVVRKHLDCSGQNYYSLGLTRKGRLPGRLDYLYILQSKADTQRIHNFATIGL